MNNRSGSSSPDSDDERKKHKKRDKKAKKEKERNISAENSEDNHKTKKRHSKHVEAESSDCSERKKHKEHEKSTGEDESEPKKSKKHESDVGEDAEVGQWATAEFEDKAKQNKFYRLLGGMKNKDKDNIGTKKKGLFGGLEELRDNQKGGNYAMTSGQQDTWQKNMENQYEQALARKGQRGKGLGYEKPPEEEKTFHIDVNKSNSIKFSD